MIIFIIGYPFIYLNLKGSGLLGRHNFMRAYVFLMLSNIFTVIETFSLAEFFNICEHVFILFGSIMFLLAVIELTGENYKKPPDFSEHLKR